MKRLLHLILALLLLCGTAISASVSPHVIAASRVKDAIAEAMQKAGFQIIGSGGSMMDEVHHFYLCCDTCGYASVDDLRELALAAREVCLKIGRDDADLQPYLDEGPFSNRHLSLHLAFSSVDSIWAPKGYVSGASTQRGGIIYWALIDPKVPSRVIHMESFEEAASRVKGLSLEAAMKAIPRTPEEAGPPLWTDADYYECTRASQDLRSVPFSNPMFAEKKGDSASSSLPDEAQVVQQDPENH